jgi:hypothetical protein
MRYGIFLEFVIGIDASETTSAFGELRRLPNDKRTRKRTRK